MRDILQVFFVMAAIGWFGYILDRAIRALEEIRKASMESNSKLEDIRNSLLAIEAEGLVKKK